MAKHSIQPNHNTDNQFYPNKWTEKNLVEEKIKLLIVCLLCLFGLSWTTASHPFRVNNQYIGDIRQMCWMCWCHRNIMYQDSFRPFWNGKSSINWSVKEQHFYRLPGPVPKLLIKDHIVLGCSFPYFFFEWGGEVKWIAFCYVSSNYFISYMYTKIQIPRLLIL